MQKVKQMLANMNHAFPEVQHVMLRFSEGWSDGSKSETNFVASNPMASRARLMKSFIIVLYLHYVH